MKRKLVNLTVALFLAICAFPSFGVKAYAKELFIVNLLASGFKVVPGESFRLEFFIGKLDTGFDKVYVKLESSVGFSGTVNRYDPPCKDFYTIATSKSIENRIYNLNVSFWTQDKDGKILQKQTLPINVTVMHPVFFEINAEKPYFMECSPMYRNPDNVAVMHIRNYSAKNITGADFEISYDPAFSRFVGIVASPLAAVDYVIKENMINVVVSKMPPAGHDIFSTSLSWTKVKFDKSPVRIKTVMLWEDDSQMQSEDLPKPTMIELRYIKSPDPVSFELTYPAKLSSPWPQEFSNRSSDITTIARTRNDNILLKGKLISGMEDSYGFIYINGSQVSVSLTDWTFKHECLLPKEGRNIIRISSFNYFGLSESLLFSVVRDTTPPDLMMSGNQMQYIPGNGTYMAKTTGYTTEVTIYSEKGASLTINDKAYPVAEDTSIVDEHDAKKWYTKAKLETRNKTNEFEIICKDSLGNTTKKSLKITR